jgi:hypothetical protein
LTQNHSRMAVRWGWVAKSRWPIVLPANPTKKSGSNFAIASIHSLYACGSGVGAVGENRALCFFSIRYASGMDTERSKELWDRLENEPERTYRAFECLPEPSQR